MRGNMLQACSLAAGLDYVPHDILRDALPPHLSRPGDGSEYPSLRDPGRHRPLIKRCFNPSWNRDGPNVTALADQIHHCPVPLAHLDFIQPQAHKFPSENHNQTTCPALRSRAWLACYRHKNVAALLNFALHLTNYRRETRAA